MKRVIFSWAVVASSLLSAGVRGEYTSHMQQGDVILGSAGQIAFAPEGILLVADPKNAQIVAIATDDQSISATTNYSIENLDEKIAGMLGSGTKEIQIVDMATNPLSQLVYLSVARGRGPNAIPVLLKLKPDGSIQEVGTQRVLHSTARLPNPAEDKEGRRGNPRTESITDIAFIDGKVFVAGLSNEEFASNLRIISFPFDGVDRGTSIEIYHGAHGALETRSPVRTFAAYSIHGQEHLLAAYTCTPLVKIPVNALEAGRKIRGTTVAELGNRNRPLDMVVYRKDGKDFVLMANSARGVMKISTEQIADIEAIESKVSDKAGLSYETISELQGVEQLDRLSDTQAVILARPNPEGPASLNSIPLP